MPGGVPNGSTGGMVVGAVVKGAVAAAVSEKAETTVQKKTLCPRWDEVFALGLPEVRHATCADT